MVWREMRMLEGLATAAWDKPPYLGGSLRGL